MVKIKLTLFGFLFLLMPLVGWAWGVVYDPVNHIQNIKTAIATFMTYQKLATQLGYLKNKQYGALTGQLSQLKKTYGLNAENLQSLMNLQHLLKNNNLMINAYNGRSDYSLLSGLNPDSGNYQQNRDAILQEYYHVPENPDKVNQDLGGFLSGAALNQMTADAELHKNNWQRVTDAVSVAAKQKFAQTHREAQVKVLSERLGSLGPKSELQTEQLIAAELILLLQQQESETKALHDMQQSEVNQLAEQSSANAEDFEHEQSRLVKAANQGASGYGKDEWGNF